MPSSGAASRWGAVVEELGHGERAAADRDEHLCALDFGLGVDDRAHPNVFAVEHVGLGDLDDLRDVRGQGAAGHVGRARGRRGHLNPVVGAVGEPALGDVADLAPEDAGVDQHVPVGEGVEEADRLAVAVELERRMRAAPGRPGCRTR